MDNPSKTNGEHAPAAANDQAAPAGEKPTTELLALTSQDLMQSMGVDGVVVIALTREGLVVGACAEPDGPTMVLQAMLRACKRVFDAVDNEIKGPTETCRSCRGEGRLDGVVCLGCGGRKRVPRG